MSSGGVMSTLIPRNTTVPCNKQGLTLVQFSAQAQPFLTQNAPCAPPNTP